MLRLLIGGSPCTHWSIAQTKNRETEPAGLGWELFLNFLIALEKYRPDYFLYENNKSMAKAIREEITRRFGFEPICINSALVSAQNRQRLYWLGKRELDGTYSRVAVSWGVTSPNITPPRLTSTPSRPRRPTIQRPSSLEMHSK